ncbi:PstS family phosphate ABC transporter substrate-binding protein [Rhizohabitans arisaemae]|uniref:PstS family phosphate ABC transporter substrate-binding protein n=1 Tax=Rhizohabitans arisaemae TaxID=2720610 RepID=UPI0024B1C530|nr:PstS family phosphate ABC transporter substrate-binding protein [Rhizohabitans arisaemae]
MTIGQRRLGLAATATLVAALTAACGGGSGAAPAAGDASRPAAESDRLSGEIKSDGSSTVGPLTTAAAELFAEGSPRVRISVGTSGTGGGFEKFCAGETDISNASRPIKDEEKAACAAKGITFTELIVATDALTVVTGKDNTWATCLTVEQLKKAWEPAAEGKITTWNQLDPKFPAEPLKVAGPGTDSGTFDYFTDAINGEEGASRKDYSASENDNDTVTAVAGAKGGLGYFGFTYFEENSGKLKALEVDSGKGCVAPSVQTAQDGSYAPLSRPLYVYIKNESVKRPEVKAFVDYYAANISKIATEARFIPLNAEQEATLKSAVDSIQTS